MYIVLVQDSFTESNAVILFERYCLVDVRAWKGVNFLWFGCKDLFNVGNLCICVCLCERERLYNLSVADKI